MSRQLIALSIVASAASPALAERIEGANSDADPIVVTADHLPYGVRSTETATKTSAEAQNIPQAMTTVSRSQISDQQLRSIGDLLLFVPGASYGSGEGNRDQLVLRGNSSTADFFVDGVRDDVQYFRDFYNVDRVEVLKGPNAMTFGRGGGGGIVNRVLKRPTFSPLASAAVSTDNWGAKRVEADLDEPLSDTVGARMNAMFEDSISFRNHARLKRYGINPTLALRVGTRTRIDVSYEHFYDWRTADRGVPANGDAPLQGFTHIFFGDPDISFSRAKVDLATIAVEHRFGGGLVLKNRTQSGDYHKFYQNIFPNSFDQKTALVALAGYNNRNDRKALYSETDLTWDNHLGGLNQTWLIGAEFGREWSRNTRATAVFQTDAFVPLDDPTISADVVFAPSSTDANNRARVTASSVYLQDEARPARWLHIVAGLRFDAIAIGVDDLRALGGRFNRVDHLWSPRLGAVLKPTDQLSIYTSYSRSYLPQSGDQFSSLTSITQALKPERFDNYEVGAKLLLPGGLLATAAVYRLDRTNTRTSDPSNPALTVLTGAQRSKGLELGLERSLAKNWLVAGGYALEKAEITSTTSAAPAGREVPLVPRHSFSLWTRYQATRRVALGAALIARSRSYATISNAVALPAYARVDAALYYRFPLSIDAQVNVENLLGAHYFPTANADNNIVPGAPRTVRMKLTKKF